MKNALLRACLIVVVGLSLPLSVHASQKDDIAELKQTLEQIKHQYESRITDLEKRIQAAEENAINAETKAQTAERKAAHAEKKVTVNRGDNAFNPAISLIVQGSASSYSQDPEAWYLPGFQTGGEAGLKSEGLSLTETELTASANVDNWFFAQATIGMHEHHGSTELDIEEAFVDTLSLPAGLGMRFGRFYTETGYINASHSHAWDFADAPLVSQAFLGKQYRDDGLRLSWIAPTDTFVEAGTEALRGERFPASGNGSKFVGDAQNYFLRLGNDLGSSHSFRIGLSHLRTNPVNRAGGDAHGHDEHTETQSLGFSGNSNLSIADLIWKWAPEGDMTHRNLTLQGEYFHRDEDGSVTLTEGTEGALFDYNGAQRGFYLQGVYQFIPSWRLGIRYDRLWSDNSLSVLSNTTGENDNEVTAETGLLSDYKPERWTAMVDWSPSEFSRLRLQYALDESRPEKDNQVQLQYIMTLGAHGTHRY
ncbi:MAG: hypothetical protein JMN27_11980 [gamma proteobacterium endosymbiont of Lamellibrachia anaximandri]|nr:hypothetical protein [gamma proteobacterium endosymbiont of Lamellibrachia anaximandri]MBL3534540.1 hypothetical protein [gamma proteobacterium endosymbiont of Lamellibrachia anaximandri]